MTAAARPWSPRGVPMPVRVTHDEAEIEAAGMNQESLQRYSYGRADG